MARAVSSARNGTTSFWGQMLINPHSAPLLRCFPRAWTETGSRSRRTAASPLTLLFSVEPSLRNGSTEKSKVSGDAAVLLDLDPVSVHARGKQRSKGAECGLISICPQNEVVPFRADDTARAIDSYSKSRISGLRSEPAHEVEIETYLLWTRRRGKHHHGLRKIGELGKRKTGVGKET